MGSRSFYVKVKCVISRIIGIVGLLILWPLFIVIAIAIKLDSRGPVFFTQERLGLHGKTFLMYKFRSMKVNAEHTGSGVYSDDRDPRVTRVGRFLRKTSLDEIPQLINLANGTMHLISCRPPLVYHPWPLDQYTQEQRHMFDLRPGLTGWAQIHGRKDVEWHKRIRLNVWYTRHVSLPLDIYIFIMTIFKVLTNEDNENKEKTV
jgi:sugar transferase EpsL